MGFKNFGEFPGGPVIRELHASTAGVLGLIPGGRIPGQGDTTSHTTRPKINLKIGGSF